MAKREEYDESLYVRPKDGAESEKEKQEPAPKEENGAASDSPKAPERTEKPKGRRRRFMEDEPPEEPEKPEQNEEAADGTGEEDGAEADARRAEEAAGKRRGHNDRKGKKRIGSGSGFYSDDASGSLKRALVIILVLGLFAVVAVMTISSFVDVPMLETPRRLTSAIVTPVQRLFSSAVDSIASYVRTLKIRGEIEYRYEELLKQLDDLASQAAMAEEYRNRLAQYQDLESEMARNEDMLPIPAAVIGHDTGNYFSILTIDIGSNQGVQNNMAVVYAGGLVGYTYDVEASQCKVLCIIDGDATVAAMVFSSRDQGSVKGTMSIDGTAMCRMYYLPDNSLPRPGDLVVTSGVGVEFPKGIPIGYVRESTRGMDENKSYIVVEPIVDFQHLEYVVVYRYRPAYTENVQARMSGAEATLIPLRSPRPQATFQLVESGGATETPDPNATPSPVPTETPTPTPEPTPSPTPDPNATPVPENLSYNAPENVAGTPTPSPTPEPTPSPTPEPTFDPGSLTVEEEED
ncbi:MAG: rod shape-determining protein MreC [Clostridia bacterium]|nr:rod shape-determining protein MreC [Clostridia bacterium]